MLKVIQIFVSLLIYFVINNEIECWGPNYREQYDEFRKEPRPIRFRTLIRGGKDTKPGQVPYQVSLNKPETIEGILMYASFCGGNIIGETQILTAAHCFLTNKKRLKISLSTVRAVAGDAVNLDRYPAAQLPENGQWRSIVDIASPRYYRYPLNDIAILFIHPSWEYSASVNFIPYASVTIEYWGSCTAIGYGVRSGTKTPSHLQLANLTVISRRKCENLYLKNMWDFICTTKSSTDTTDGDSGSGLVCFNTGDPEEVDSRGLLVGIQSQTSTYFPSKHTRISRFHRWIKDAGVIVQYSLIVYCTSIAVLVIAN